MMLHHFCEIRIFSDRLYIQTFPGDFDSDLFLKKSYKEQNRWQLSRVNIDHRLDSCGAPRGQGFYLFNMKEYPNV